MKDCSKHCVDMDLEEWFICVHRARAFLGFSLKMIMEVPRKTFSESDLSFTCLKSLYIKEGTENQMLTLIIVLFCYAKVGVGDMNYYGIKNSE